MVIKRLVTEGELRTIVPLVAEFFTIVNPSYTPEAFWRWTMQPNNYIMVQYTDTYIPVAYVAFCFHPAIGGNYIFMFQSYAQRGIDTTMLWKWLMRMSDTLKLPLLTHTNRSEKVLERKYGFKRDSVIMVRQPQEE